MNQEEFTKAIRALNTNKAKFATYLGIDRATVYRWKEVPVYAQKIITLLSALNEYKEMIAPKQ